MVAAIVAVLVAVDPIGIARVWPSRQEAAAVVGGALAVAALLGDTVLDVLDLSPPGFWLAAGIVLLVPAFARLGAGATRDVAGPASILVAVATATRDGTGEAVAAAAVAAAVTLVAVAFVRESRMAARAERAVGAAMVVIALDLIRDGVMAV